MAFRSKSGSDSERDAKSSAGSALGTATRSPGGEQAAHPAQGEASEAPANGGLPTISQPKGGGAIRGIGETFSTNPTTGTATFRVPIACSPGRSGFSPVLALGYDSGAGNGPFGFGWSLSLPSITRKTDKGLPRYTDGTESDIFLISESDDLVPVIGTDGIRYSDTTSAPGYTIHRYRPRIEGSFVRIERWTHQSDGDVHWRSITRDNIVALYGRDASSRIADPADPRRVFSWLLCESRDDKGNAILYDYKPEDGAGADLALPHQRNRGAQGDVLRTAQRYLKRIRYGNRESLLDGSGLRPQFLSDAQRTGTHWMFEVVLDYGEHDPAAPTPNDSGSWTYRGDAFSTRRPAFEVRTTRLCQRVLIFHHFPNDTDVGNNCLVRSTDFTYAAESATLAGGSPGYSFLRAVTQCGYRRSGFGYLKRTVPPVEYRYSEPVVQSVVQDVDHASLDHLPIGIDGTTYQWTDLHGEGTPGILTEQAGAWFYKRNLSGLADGPARLAPTERVELLPNQSLRNAQFADLAGDGTSDVVVFDAPVPGFYEHDDAEGWRPFQPFTARLNRDAGDPNTRLVDLDGDGHADLLITEADSLVWHPSLAERGFDAARRVRLPLDQERGPRVVFADRTEAIHLADMTGDGLSDVVRIRNGEVCYWPNLGYGRFGAKVTMDASPRFDHPEQFEVRRLRLADIDGSGTTDLIYLRSDGIHVYFNRSGNAWSPAQRLPASPRVDSLSEVHVLDLLGNGTACVVWSSPAPGDARRPLRYVDLMAGQKPHLLVSSANNLGAETHVHYVSSTRFYLADRAAGKKWITRLPFPVHVVDQVETVDRIGGNRFVTRYRYHHGHFDGIEREFRGFGMVEQLDTEELRTGDSLPTASNLDAASQVPPVLTRTWFHTGIYLGGDRVSRYFAGTLDATDPGEYYREPGADDAAASRLLLDDTALPAGLTLDEEREACRALKGMMLRQEVYALDGSASEPHPYTVTEQNFTLRRLQARGANRNSVFLAHPRESLAYHYERVPHDPRTTHSVTLAVNDYGDVLRSATVTYGRRNPASELESRDQALQAELHVSYVDGAMADAITTATDYRGPRSSETRNYEITGLALGTGAIRFTLDQLSAAGSSAAELAYDQAPTAGVLQKRVIEHVRTLYQRNDLTGALALGQQDSLGLTFESYRLAFTSGLVARVYGTKVTAAALVEGGYVHLDGDDRWWIPSGRLRYSADPAATAATELARARQHFFLPQRYIDPFGNGPSIAHDADDLLIVEGRDSLGNATTSGERDTSGAIVVPGNDYRVLAPRIVTDPNGNRLALAFDALGMVVGTAVMGKRNETPRRGDLLSDFVADLSDDAVAAHLASPLADPASILGHATSRFVYDLFAYQRTRDQVHPRPCVAYSLVRETHDADLATGQVSRLQHSFTYSDGFGREIQKKVQAEPGPVPTRDGSGAIIVDGNGIPVMTTTDVSPRWVGSGWTVFDNKAQPVRKFEPFFSDAHLFEPDLRIGVSATLFYDPVGRLVATLQPDHAWSKTVFGPWRQEIWDVTDTVLIADPRLDADVGNFFGRQPQSAVLPTWYAARQGGALGSDEQIAAAKSAVYAATPTVSHTDSLGRTILSIAHNRFVPSDAQAGAAPIDELYPSRTSLDLENNVREVRDARDRIVERYDHDMLGTRARRSSMEAGEQWVLNDIGGRPIRSWSSRGHRGRVEYDAARRPVRRFVTGAVTAQPSLEILFEKLDYGEGQPDDQANNLRARLARRSDSAGVTVFEQYDFKGNPLRTRRQLASDYHAIPDWSGSPALDADSFVTTMTYDALNRPTSTTTPDASVSQVTFNEANLLETITVRLQGSATPTSFVAGISYDAKGQRQRIQYGNGVTTDYSYDRTTLRVSQIRTLRGGQPLQDLSYTYDVAGQVSRIHDAAQQTIYFANQVVTPDCDYTYDAIRRMIAVNGREHIGQVSQPQTSWDDGARIHLPQPGDGQAMRLYSEGYAYDPCGNLIQLAHRATGGNWTRTYTYQEASVLEPTKQSNRLTSTSVGSGTPIVESYAYDAHGNTLSLSHLPHLDWDFKDQLRSADLGGGGTAYYTYDAAGKRARKVIERSGGLIEERIYLDGIEIYRKRQGGALTLERQTLHVSDDIRCIALVETRTQGSEPGLPAQLVRFQLSNHVGSASLELDNQAQIISYEEYYPFGSTSYQAVRSQTETPKRYRYLAMERDEETGFGYHTARYYLPWLGRWLSADPAGIGVELDVYAYCHNNPVNLCDTNGKDWTLAEINKFIDTNGDHRISASELANLGCIKGVTLESWATQMRFMGGGYRVDGNLQKIIEVISDVEIARRVEESARARESDDNTLRTDGTTIYTPRQAREYKDRRAKEQYSAKNLIAPAVILVAVIQPEVIAVYGAYDTGVHIGNTITGRDSGADVPSILQGRFGNAAILTDAQHADEAAKALAGIIETVAGGAALARSEEGVAIVRYYRNADGTPHWTVETVVPDQPNLTTHLQITSESERTTEITKVTKESLKGKQFVKAHKAPLAKPDRARAVQEYQLERGDAGQFARQGPKANSCATAVCQVVSAGGGNNFPYKPQDAANFLRMLFGLPLLK